MRQDTCLTSLDRPTGQSRDPAAVQVNAPDRQHGQSAWYQPHYCARK